MSDIVFIEQLETLIRDRLRDSPEGSYTADLGEKGLLAIAQKVGEEGVELALAGAAQEDNDVIAETADLIFHVLVLLAKREIPFSSVVETLQQRHRARLPK